MKNPARIPAKVKAALRQRRPVGREPAQPVPHHLAQRAGGQRRRLRRRELPGVAQGADRRGRAHPGVWWASGSPPARTRSARRSAAWCRGWSPASSTRPPRRPSGPPPATTAAAARTTRRCWAASPSPSCPKGMSRERFEWLSKVAGEVIATPGTESNVKEIFDKCWELRRSGQDLMIFNQFEEFGNDLWHYDVTGQRHRRSAGEGAAARRDAGAARSSPPAPRAPSAAATS